MAITILHTESSTGWGGQENRILQECIGLRQLGAKPIILCQPDSMLAKRASAEKIETRTCRMRKSYDISAIRYIFLLIAKENIDVVSTHSGRDSLLAGIAGRLSRKRPLIVRTRHLALPITSRVTYSLLPHMVVTVSESVRQYLIREGINNKKVIAVPTGIDVNRFDPDKVPCSLRHELGLKPDVHVVGTISILRYKKGHHILLDAIPLVLNKMPQTVFIFAGDGPQKENILNKIKKLGLGDKVLMLGMRKDIPEILKSIDIFVLPTLQEALGTSFIEAMAMEKPVIGVNVNGVSEVITNSLNGYLVQPNNPPALAEAILDLLQNRGKAKAMGIEGRKIAHENFTVGEMCKKMFELYSSMLNGKTS